MAGAAPEDQFNLYRFVEAQEGSYSQALAEIQSGSKRTHWMWYIFPQIAGLGSSSVSQHFAIGSLAEARAYIRHPVLGVRYEECVRALQTLTNTTADRVFGNIDALKLRSSLTLFSKADDRAIFEAALSRWFENPDEATLRNLAAAS